MNIMKRVCVISLSILIIFANIVHINAQEIVPYSGGVNIFNSNSEKL